MKRISHLWIQLSETLAAPVWLSIRAYVGWVFFASGRTKIADWENTVFLFQHEYAVPYIPHELAAYGATAVELICPVLLWLGLATRFAVAPLLVLVAVIEFTYTSHITHIYWALLLLAILTHGADKWSLDYMFWRRR